MTDDRDHQNPPDRESGVTRRRVLQALAALPVAAPAVVKAAGMKRVIVVGAGAFGGWTALQLQRAGAVVTLIDAWGAGNSRSSSGGESRVIRSIYGPDRDYVEMVLRSFELWGRLDASTDESLYEETGALWMLRGDDDYVQSSLPVLSELGFPVERLPPAVAASRWPQIDFSGVRTAYLERRAGTLAARRCCQVVLERFLEAGGRYRVAKAEPGEVVGGRLDGVVLDDGSHLQAHAYVFACGPWLGRLFPDVLGGDRIRPSRQDVFYFGPPAGSTAYGPANLPVWIDFGERVVYGLPDVHGRGFKLADDTRGPTIDPSTEHRAPSDDALVVARDFLAGRFPGLADAPLLESRVCQYENSLDGHLVLDQHPNAPNLWLAGGGSGHGFKLAPAVGDVVANAILGEGELPARFGLARLDSIESESTQMGVEDATETDEPNGEGR